MAGKVRYLIERGGRYHARIVVPKDLRPIIGKVELSAPLGADRREALSRLPAVTAGMLDQLTAAKRKLASDSPGSDRPARARRLDAIEMARIQFSQRLEFDTEARNTDWRYAAFGFADEGRVTALKAIIAGAATDEEIGEAIGGVIRYFHQRGAHDHAPGSPEWRSLARVLAQADLAAMNVAALRDQGEPDPPAPAMLDAVGSLPSGSTAPTGIREIFDGHRRELQKTGKGQNAEYRWLPVIESLTDFLKHDDARRITRRDIIRWKDRLSESLAPKTVRDFYLASTRAAFNWALDNELVEANPVAGVKVQVARKALGREKGFNDEEALAILKAARAYERPSRREHPTMVAAKRWAPLLAAYSGARIAEITQLRVQDLYRQSGIPFMRLTPEAGSIKANVYRDVPIHPHLIELGFLDFVHAAKPGPLFYRQGPRVGRAHPAKIVADRVGKWIRDLKIADDAVAPNHGWRHRLKTVGLEAGIDSRVLDAIQGHAPRTAGENYGDVTLKAKRAAIERIPPYGLA